MPPETLRGGQCLRCPPPPLTATGRQQMSKNRLKFVPEMTLSKESSKAAVFFLIIKKTMSLIKKRLFYLLTLSKKSSRAACFGL